MTFVILYVDFFRLFRGAGLLGVELECGFTTSFAPTKPATTIDPSVQPY